ncbi:MAG: prepilin peptidase, partial [Chloroflexi bacterium]|nr:prepilin peptidase [Chloroflexota bacterium]
MVVEASMAVIVLMLLDAFFIGQVRSGVCANGGRFGLTDDLASDWQILLAHVILFACLLSMSAIDLEHYWVDVRFTNAATAVGFVLHTLWTPKHSAGWIRPFDTTAVMAILAIVGMGVVWLVLRCRPAVAEPLHGAENGAEPLHGTEVPTGKEAFGAGGSSQAENCAAPPSRAFGWAARLVLLGLFAVLLLDSGTNQP